MKQKTWLITGISSGLGKALAEAVLATGDFVAGTFRDQAQADAFNSLHKENARGLQLNLKNAGEIQTLCEKIKAEFGSIDVLVNNAGMGFAGAIEETSDEETREVFEVNFFGALEMTRAFLPLFRQQKHGHIIQISSHGGIKASAGFGIYNASKFALEGFSEALAQEIAPLGIRLTIVEPGPFRTNFAGNNFGLAKNIIADYTSTAGVFRERIKGVDGKQEGDPAKAAKAIIALVNANSSTLRLPLGKIAIGTITAKLESVQHDLEANREIAEKAVY
jgi:NAD(P)-dependent dehydrogenase (short-subunit alcohol dehydrogenase family)